MGRLINIDNGGTLTDICVWDGAEVTFTKTLTTPFDLSQCLFEGMTKVSGDVFGTADLSRLLHDTQHIRYSTTQGTNALVERKGPAIGLLTDDPAVVEELRGTPREADLFDGLVGTRVEIVDTGLDDDALADRLVATVNRLTTAGAERLVVAAGSEDGVQEARIRRIVLRKFPRHLLGSVPVLYATDLTTDRNRARRVWSGVVNSFLHPTIEGFLYNTEDRLRGHRVKNPLLIYRNDGASSRVAKSVALKTYSSGPRGGLEGTRELARAYGFDQVLMIDVGGTTTDVGQVRDAEIRVTRRGSVKGVPISFPMSEVHSSGVGGSSIISVTDGEITVGPESVGSAPGPACFGFGGRYATITDVNLLLGVLDPKTYLDGGFALDPERARTVVEQTVAEPLGVSVGEALVRMEEAYFAAIARAFAPAIADPARTTLAAFGGAGPMSACGAARREGVRRVVVPRLAAVFSAFGIGFSDIAQHYDATLEPDVTAGPDEGVGIDGATAAAAYDHVLGRAERDMFQEGHALADCTVTATVLIEDPDGAFLAERPYRRGDAIDLGDGEHATLTVGVTHALPHVSIDVDPDVAPVPAVADGFRTLRSGPDGLDDVPVYRLVDQAPGARAEGPAVVEGPFFTARVLDGWSFEVSSVGDLLLTDTAVPAGGDVPAGGTAPSDSPEGGR